MALTKKQRQILDYVESFVDSYGYSPSFEEIADHFGYSSLATVHEHLSNLERRASAEELQQESFAGGGAVRGGAGGGAAAARHGGGRIADRGDRGAGDGLGPARHAALAATTTCCG
jgi:hypothetical protein